jgi:hypothetical protein
MVFSCALSACGSPFTTAASLPFCCFSHKHVRSQTSIWWARSVPAQGYTSLPRCRFLQPAPCPASGFHGSGTGGISGSEQCFPQPVHHDAVTVAAIFLDVPCCLPATRGTHIRNNQHRNNTRRIHKVRLVHFRASFIRTHIPSHRAEQRERGATAVVFSSGSNVGVSSHLNPNPPSNAYYPNSRTRANTINHMDRIPPALARLQHMSQDVISGRNALTPVLNRDDAIKEWERRQSGKAATAQPYPQLEFLQQQAELVAASGIASWQQPATRYQPTQSSGLAHQYHPPAAIVVDDERRDAIMSNVRATAQGQTYISSNTISNPPAAYTGAPTTAGSRFTVTYPQQPPAGSQSQSQQHAQPPQQQQQQQSPTSPFDSLDRRPDMGGLFVPLQPDHLPAIHWRFGRRRPRRSSTILSQQSSLLSMIPLLHNKRMLHRSVIHFREIRHPAGAVHLEAVVRIRRRTEEAVGWSSGRGEPCRSYPALNLLVWLSLHRSRLL